MYQHEVEEKTKGNLTKVRSWADVGPLEACAFAVWARLFASMC